MPLVLDRRHFLKSAIAAGAGASVLNGANEQSRIALLSDTHIAADPEDSNRGFFPHKNLKAVCEQVGQSPFDMLLVNGDLARQSGQPADYAAFRNFLTPLAERLPMLLSLGNHDDRKNARSQVTGRAGDLQPVEQKMVSTVDAGPVHIVVLDSLMITNIAAGQVGKKQREWLKAYLGGPLQKPVVVFVHHNPDAEDDNSLLDAGLLLPILAANRNVKALFFGHTHVFKTTQLDGMHLVNLPAVGYNFADGVAIGWIDSTFKGDGMRLQLHAVGGDKTADGKVTELAWRR